MTQYTKYFMGLLICATFSNTAFSSDNEKDLRNEDNRRIVLFGGGLPETIFEKLSGRVTRDHIEQGYITSVYGVIKNVLENCGSFRLVCKRWDEVAKNANYKNWYYPGMSKGIQYYGACLENEDIGSFASLPKLVIRHNISPDSPTTGAFIYTHHK